MSEVELTKDQLIRELKAGATLSRVLARHGARQALVNRWKNTDRIFVQQLDQALAERHRSGHATLEQRHPDLHDRFIAACEALGKKVSVAAACRVLRDDGLSVSDGSIYARLQPGNSLYDPNLAERYLEVEAQWVGAVEDKHRQDVLDTKDIRFRREALERNPLTSHRYRKPADRFEVDLHEQRTLRVVQEHRKVLHLSFQREAEERFGPTTHEVIDVEPTEREQLRVPAGGEEEEAGGREEGEEAAQAEDRREVASA